MKGRARPKISSGLARRYLEQRETDRTAAVSSAGPGPAFSAGEGTYTREMEMPSLDNNAAACSTTGADASAPSDRHSLTIGPSGSILLHDVHFLEQMAHFNRKKVPERQLHAKASGAFGVFQVTEDVSAYTKAAMLRRAGLPIAGPLFDCRWRNGQSRYLARGARFFAKVLHRRGQLRSRRQEYAGFLPARPDEVSVLHPEPEETSRLGSSFQPHAMGFLDA